MSRLFRTALSEYKDVGFGESDVEIGLFLTEVFEENDRTIKLA